MNWTLLSSALIAAGLHAALLGLRISPALPRVPERTLSDQIQPVDEDSWYKIVEEPTICRLWIGGGCGCPLVRMRPPPIRMGYASRPIASYLSFEPIRPPTLPIDLRARDLTCSTEVTVSPRKSTRP